MVAGQPGGAGSGVVQRHARNDCQWASPWYSMPSELVGIGLSQIALAGGRWLVVVTLIDAGAAPTGGDVPP